MPAGRGGRASSRGAAPDADRAADDDADVADVGAADARRPLRRQLDEVAAHRRREVAAGDAVRLVAGRPRGARTARTCAPGSIATSTYQSSRSPVVLRAGSRARSPAACSGSDAERQSRRRRDGRRVARDGRRARRRAAGCRAGGDIARWATGALTQTGSAPHWLTNGKPDCRARRAERVVAAGREQHAEQLALAGRVPRPLEVDPHAGRRAVRVAPPAARARCRPSQRNSGSTECTTGRGRPRRARHRHRDRRARRRSARRRPARRRASARRRAPAVSGSKYSRKRVEARKR